MEMTFINKSELNDSHQPLTVEQNNELIDIQSSEEFNAVFKASYPDGVTRASYFDENDGETYYRYFKNI